MEQLTWSGSFGAFLNPLILLSVAIFIVGFLANFVLTIAGVRAGELEFNGDGTMSVRKTPIDYALMVMKYAVLLFVACCAGFIIGGIVLPTIEQKGILGAMAERLLPVWIALIVTFAISITYKRKLGLYGKLFDSPIGMAGFFLVMFWVFAAIFSGVFPLVPTHGAIDLISGLRNDLPGTPLPDNELEEGVYPYYLLGGDNLGRDVFSRVFFGAADVLRITPIATLFAFMVGITLGLPAGYFGGRLDSALTFIANLALAFPVILLFFLLVTPEIVAAGVPQYMSMVLFLFPILFLIVLFNSRFHTAPMKRNIYVGIAALVGFWAYFSLISNASDPDAPLRFWPEALDGFDVAGNLLIVFVSVVFVNSPTVFRIVRGITLDVKTRDYVAAAQTRGEGPWYIMLWEILPNARGPLIVDFCLRIGYTTILLGTLGFFGLGVSPESPDWGSTINEGRRLLTIYPHPALPPALALMTLVLGLNLLADGLREESLKD
ncbi:ABC transporter permease [Gymnodinialimonas ceratoperidinii]|uniref:ABC transporter permease n=1 Tax=Gymnodinialimonas ceratoperidinii TaxID=2856823 RepID=A0A8F6Y917_9RHOB|nr:ABC transporter permease [Gymnodinialimonas ceratoperidinii]QXT38484.1 ABC transporter permease [Gymnodinialimonas ceratoperidinii]